MKRKNKSTLLVCINCMIITLAILLLPLAFFETSIYVKRSANTFVGDEKYVEARAEVEAVAAQHEGAVIEESVTERVVEVNRPTWWQKLWMGLGRVFAGAVAITVIYKLLKQKVKL